MCLQPEFCLCFGNCLKFCDSSHAFISVQGRGVGGMP